MMLANLFAQIGSIQLIERLIKSLNQDDLEEIFKSGNLWELETPSELKLSRFWEFWLQDLN